ncbi:MAG: DNA polymerase I [Bdellovibrionaceae bacterium]|nr:DNA polymerase I [Pseudobdellovibrionaceae bacterium]
MKKLYLVDVSAMFFRAYYAIPNLRSKEGFPTNALYGFVSMTVKLLNDYKPDYMVYCFDRPEPSFRKELDPRYKANRTEMPEDLQLQVPYIKEITDLLGIPRLDILGFEADDLIGSYARWGEENGFEVVIVSADKDFAQIITDKTVMLDTMKSVTYDVNGVKEKWGVQPRQFIDYLALIGDSSDNVPGVRGVGPKTAQKLIADHDNLDAIYAAVESIKGSLQTKLIENKDEAYLSKTLVTIKTDVEVPTDADFFKMKFRDEGKLKELFAKFSFKTFAEQLLGTTVEEIETETSSKATQYEILKDQVVAALKDLKEGSSVYFFEEHPYYFLIEGQRAYLLEEITDEVRAVLSSKRLKWSGYDLKTLWKELGIETAEFEDDLMLAAYAVNAGNIDFRTLHQEYLGPSVPDGLSPLALINAHMRLLEKIKHKMPESVRKVYEDIEKPIMPILLKMEKLGVRIDTEILEEQSKSLKTDIEILEKEIHELAGEEFNINSPKQLGEILFTKMNIATSKKTKTGFSTATEVLEKLTEYPIAGKVLEYRELAKLKSTYVDALPKLVHADTGRVHTTFRQALTTTGRLSSVNPNLQNIPIRTEKGILVRKAFVPTPGWELIAADYSQIELRVLAHIAGDSALIEAYKNDRDIHAVTASEVFGIAISDVDRNQRRIAKAVNFGIAYGQGAYGLAENLKISRTEAKGIIETYFNKFPGIKAYMDEIVRVARDQGYVETILGRRRYLPELKSKNRVMQAFGERAAINAPMQGTASDIVKLAMIEVHKQVKAPMILQVHDELIFECEPAEIQEQMKLIQEVMENIIELKVPLVVNCSKGKNWLEAH